MNKNNKIDVETYQELKKIAEDTVSNFFKTVGREKGERYCIVDKTFNTAPLIIAHLSQLERLNFKYDYIVFHVYYNKYKGIVGIEVME